MAGYSSVYDVDFNSRQPAVQTIQLPPIPPPSPRDGPTRLEVLEERVAQQERTSQALLDKAMKIKEDVVDSLNFTHGTWQDEKHSRGMLQEHIRSITAVVNRLNSDIQTIDENIRARDNAAAGTNNAVKNLEVHQVSTLGDLKGRVVRCDASIAKLSSEIRATNEAIKMVSNEGVGIQGRVTERIHNLESQVMSLSKSIEKYASEQDLKLNHMEGDQSTHLSMMDAKTKALLEEMKNLVRAQRLTEENEREKLETRVIQMVDKSAHIRDNIVDKTERKIEENFMILDSRIQKLEESLLDERSKFSSFQNQIQEKIYAKLNFELRQQAEEIVKLKRECRDGFASVHESISNMKSVVEGKRKILEDQLRKEISQLRKMIVLV